MERKEIEPNQEQVEEQTKSGLQKMFDQFIQRGIDHGGVEVENKGLFYVYKRLIPQSSEKNFETSDSEAYGAIGGSPIFYRSKRKRAYHDDVEESFRWILNLEGPLQKIYYYKRNGVENLFLAFGQRQEPALGRSAQYYDNDTDFKLKFDQLFSAGQKYGRPLLNPGGPILNFCSEYNPRSSTSSLIGGYPANVIRDKLEILETIKYPKLIDKSWLPKFLDENDEIVNDPKMPWRNWFRELGCSFEFFEKTYEN